MSRRYSFTTQAVQDLEEIHNFIATDNLAAAVRLLDLLEEKLQTLAGAPEMGRSREELALALRSFPVGNYVIFYRSIEDGIHVIRILHGARDMEAIFEE